MMDNESQNNVNKYLDLFLNSGQERAFNIFLSSLTYEEAECYFYIDIHRLNTYIREMSLDDNAPVEIPDLKIKSNIHKLSPHVIKSNSALDFIVEYWEAFSGILPPTKEIRQNVIEKHNKLYRKLTDDETDFFLKC
jgi:hypothetical protein